MKTYLPISHRRRQSGFTYMTVVVTMIVAGVMLAAYLTMISVQNQLVERSQAWNRSVPVLEAGIEEALAHLNHNAAANASGIFNVNLASDGWQVHPSGGWWKTNSVAGSPDSYYVRITQFVAGNYYPFIEAEGYVFQQNAFAMHNTRGPFLAQASFGPGFTKRTVQCTTTNVPTFTKALVAKKGIDMSGQHVRTDSFDSADPLFNDGYGHYTNTMGKWKANGDIASNDFITNTVSIGNANIYGKVATGPYGTVYIGGGMVGDVAFQSNPLNVGKIQTGWSTDDMNMEIPSVEIPTRPTDLAAATPPPGGSRTIDGVVYDLYLDGGTDPEGRDYRLPSGQNLSGKIYVEGHVRLLVSDNSAINIGGQDIIKIKSGTNNSLRLYADVANVAIGGQGVSNDGRAHQFYYFGTDRNTSLSFGGNAAFTGVIYAPNAYLQLNGSGSLPVDFSGAGIARSFKLTGNFNFHYDENLARVGLYRGYVITSWNER